MKPLAPNTMIQNRYLVVQLIGKGGMGEVYLAVDQRLGSAVALKRTSFADDQMLAAAFEREAKILARLRHPVLPKVSDHFAENGEQYLVMEHISGDDLSKRLETAKKPFPVTWGMFWADQLLDALSYLHSHEPPIIHRDIKPQNLKLTDENHIVLLDFGLSKDTANKSIVSAPGSSGSVVGYTPHFAPMEQIRGTGTNPRSDIYSLSATLYQLMADVVPADALTRAEALLNGQADPLRALSDINPEISPAVSNVILKGLEVSQEKRFVSASEMQKALRAAYAQINNEMSADTVVFNLEDVTGPTRGDVHLTTPPSTANAPTAPSEMATVTAPQNQTPAPPPPIEQALSMDATLQMDTVETEAVRQADIKTEVFYAPDMPAAQVAAEVPDTVVGERADEQPAKEDTPATGAFEQAATVPLISVPETGNGRPDEPATPEFFQTAAAAVPSAAAPPIAQASSQPPSVPKKKSKVGIILGGLFGLFVLGGIVAGGGWYWYTNYYATAAATPTPTPSPTVESSPSPTATPEPSPTPDANVNADPNASNTNSTVEPTPEPSGPLSTKPTPQTQPGKTPGSKPPMSPGTKPTPKPKTNNDRTVIDQ